MRLGRPSGYRGPAKLAENTPRGWTAGLRKEKGVVGTWTLAPCAWLPREGGVTNMSEGRSGDKEGADAPEEGRPAATLGAGSRRGKCTGQNVGN